MDNYGNWFVAGVDGELAILTKDPPTKGSVGVLYNTETGVAGKEQPIQVFYKWGNFTAPKPGTRLKDL